MPCGAPSIFHARRSEINRFRIPAVWLCFHYDYFGSSPINLPDILPVSFLAHIRHRFALNKQRYPTHLPLPQFVEFEKALQIVPKAESLFPTYLCGLRLPAGSICINHLREWIPCLY